MTLVCSFVADGLFSLSLVVTLVRVRETVFAAKPEGHATRAEHFVPAAMPSLGVNILPFNLTDKLNLTFQESSVSVRATRVISGEKF